ncbi:hypothetical protein IAT40_004173 [Kwoniella sp. CBS 6097]
MPPSASSSSSTSSPVQPTGIRKSQRAPTSAHQCHREPVLVKGRLIAGQTTWDRTALDALSKEELWSQVQSLIIENEGLKKQIGLVTGGRGEKSRSESPRDRDDEDDLESSLHTSGAADSSMSRSPHSQSSNQRSTQEAHNTELSMMARKLGLIDDHSVDRYDALLDMDNIDPLLAFPPDLSPIPYDLNLVLLDFAFEELGWLICPVPISFKDQVASIRSTAPNPNAHPHSLHASTLPPIIEYIDIPQLVKVKPSWSALYLAVISAALLYVPSIRASQWGITSEQKSRLARIWFQASLNTMLNAEPLLQACLKLRVHQLRDMPDERTSTGEIARRSWSFLLSREVHYTGDDYCSSVSRLEPEPFATFLNISEPDGPGPLSHCLHPATTEPSTCYIFILRKRKLSLLHLFTNSSESIYWAYRGYNIKTFASWLIGVIPFLPGFASNVRKSGLTGAIRLYKLGFIVGFAIGFVAYLALNYIWPPITPGLEDEEDFFGTFGPASTSVETKNDYSNESPTLDSRYEEKDGDL